jgi:hypothetical protein
MSDAKGANSGVPVLTAEDEKAVMRYLAAALVTTKSWFCPSCSRVFATGHAIRTSNGARFHNQICGTPLVRVKVVKGNA